jgi:hypothetical protein
LTAIKIYNAAAIDLCRNIKVMQSEELIQELIEQTRQMSNKVESLKGLDLHTLTWKSNHTSWSILECIEHLNLYGDFYLPQIQRKMQSSTSNGERDFKPGILGNYFAQIMLPKDKLNKMKTNKDKNPLNAKLDKSVIEKFLNQQIIFLDLLHQSRHKSLNKIKITTSISSLIKLKLGDTFRFLANHNLRHLRQIERVQQAKQLA